MGILEGLATLLTIASVYAMSNDRIYHGWLVGASGNIAWILFGMAIASPGIVVVNAVMFVIYLRSIVFKGKTYAI